MGQCYIQSPTCTRSRGRRGWAISEYRDSRRPYDTAAHVTMLRRGDPAPARARTGELYDLAADPVEGRKLWDDPASTTTRADLLAMLLDVLVAA